MLRPDYWRDGDESDFTAENNLPNNTVSAWLWGGGEIPLPFSSQLYLISIMFFLRCTSFWSCRLSQARSRSFATWSLIAAPSREPMRSSSASWASGSVRFVHQCQASCIVIKLCNICTLLQLFPPRWPGPMQSPSRIFLSIPTTLCTGENIFCQKSRRFWVNVILARLEAGKLRNVGKFYSHLLHTGICKYGTLILRDYVFLSWLSYSDISK